MISRSARGDTLTYCTKLGLFGEDPGKKSYYGIQFQNMKTSKIVRYRYAMQQ